MQDNNNNNLIPERPEPIDNEIVPEDQETERPKPIETEKREPPAETKEESGLIERPKPTRNDYAEDLPKKDDEKD